MVWPCLVSARTAGHTLSAVDLLTPVGPSWFPVLWLPGWVCACVVLRRRVAQSAMSLLPCVIATPGERTLGIACTRPPVG